MPTLTSERAALDYAERDWFVMPARGKKPDGKLAPHGLRSASTDPNVICSWFRTEPDDNVAIVCRPSGLLVFDVDERHGGDDTFHELERDLGALPVTPRSLTGGGGFHVVLRNPALTTASTIGPGVDVRDRAYVIAPPSLHESGRRYCWEIDPDEAPVAELPLAWREVITRKPGNVIYRDAGPIPDGRRHTTLTQVAGAMRRTGASADEIEAALLIRNRRCVPPLPENDIRDIARWAANLRMAPLWALDAGGYVAKLAEDMPLTATQRHVLAILCHRANADGFVLGGQWIERETGFSRPTISKAIRALEAQGLADVTRHHRCANEITLRLPDV